MEIHGQGLLKYLKRDKYLYLLLILPFINIVIFKYLPMVGNILAFRDYKAGGSILGSEWEGFKNWSFLRDPSFHNAFTNSLVLSILGLFICFPLPILFALLLNEIQNLRFKRFVQTCSYLPRFISTVIVVGMINEMLSPQTGIINRLLVNVGFIEKPIYFLAEQSWFRPIYIISDIWQWTGWSAIIYMAALTGINDELYDSAMIDGASRFKQTLHVTLPGIMPTVTIMLILAIGSILSTSFEKVLLLQHDAIFHVADTIDTYVYRNGIRQGSFEAATAVGLFNAVIGVTLVTGANYFARKTSDYSLF